MVDTVNSVHLSGLLRVDEIKQVPGIGSVMEVTIFTRKREKRSHREGFFVFLTGKQIELVIKHNHVDSEKLPFVVVNGRLFRINSEAPCVVLGQHIQFTGAYEQLN